jgi:glycosyltransferase involved in cell wall biosynthesis
VLFFWGFVLISAGEKNDLQKRASSLQSANNHLSEKIEDLMILANYSAAGGIKHYFETLKTLPFNEDVEFSNFASIKSLVKCSKNSKVLFTHLTKEFIFFLILGGQGSVICHDPKLRVGFGWRDFVLLKALILFKKNVQFVFVHSEAAPWFARHFEIVKIQMPIIAIECDKRIDVLFFGRVMKYKGLHKYMKVFEKIENVKITVAGYIDPSLKRYIKKSYSCEIIEGYISDDFLECLIKKSDYVFMPYDDVTNTNVHTLSFERSKPVIRTDIPGFISWKYVNEELIFKKNDLESLEEILYKLPRTGSAKYKSMSEKSLTYFENLNEKTKYFWPQIFQKLEIMQ